MTTQTTPTQGGTDPDGPNDPKGLGRTERWATIVVQAVTALARVVEVLHQVWPW